ncbi:MAG: ferrous iron transport protein B [Eubacteriales bacterium]
MNKSKPIHVAFVGNPNCGKTTLFNAYTGAKHKVGNWPGVTVEKKEGIVNYDDNTYKLVDLPGIYSLTPYSLEEKLSRNYILNEEVDMIYNIVDASNLERQLFLTLQLIETGKPVVLIMNMMDVVEKNNIKINVEVLEKTLGIPILPVIATKKVGLKQVLNKSLEVYNEIKKYKPIKIPYSSEIEENVSVIKDLYIKNYSNELDSRWIAIKRLEKDKEILEKFPLSLSVEPKKSYEEDIIQQKYRFIKELLDRALETKKDQFTITDKVDNILTHKYFGIPIFLFIMGFVFFLTFNVGNILVEYFEVAMSFISEWTYEVLVGLKVSEWLISLIVDGIIGGVGGILVFLPNIAFLFLAMALLEDSGYMSRVAYLMDRLMKKIGLSGKAFIPMIIGFGCSVPAIMSARTLEDEKDRLVTMLIAPFMSCAARLPIYVLFSKIFFPGNEMIITYSLYILGIIVAILVAMFFRKTLKKNEITPLILELPSYKMPELKTTGFYVIEKIKGYIVRAGTIIFMASIIIWFILNFGFDGRVEMTESFGASIGQFISPFFSLAGFGEWQASLSLIAGIAGKEIVVSSMAVIYGLGEALGESDLNNFATILKKSGFTALSAYSFMVFSLLYTPCVATIGTFKKETNSWKWTIFSVIYQCLIAWLVSVIVYQIGSLFI